MLIQTMTMFVVPVLQCWWRESIQRADALLLHNTVIQYIGANEAVSVHESQPYTINRIDTVNFWGYNVASLKQQASNIIYLNFWEDELNPSSAFSGSGYSGFVPTARQDRKSVV